MFENIANFFKKFGKNEKENSKNTAKERLHLVLAQDRANISADFLEMMKQEIIDVIKKYIDIDEEAIDVRMTNKPGEDGVIGAPALYANIPIVTIKNEARKLERKISEDKDIPSDINQIEKNENELEEFEKEEKSIESEQKEHIEDTIESEETNFKENKNEKENESEKRLEKNERKKVKNKPNKKNKKSKGKRG